MPDPTGDGQMREGTEEIGTVFDVGHFCLHDGPGITTTVFLKDGGLCYLWCRNPGCTGDWKWIDPAAMAVGNVDV